MYTKLLQYPYFINLFFSFSFSVFFIISPLPSEKSKTPEYIFPRVEARKRLRIFFFFVLLEKERISYFSLKSIQYKINN